MPNKHGKIRENRQEQQQKLRRYENNNKYLYAQTAGADHRLHEFYRSLERSMGGSLHIKLLTKYGTGPSYLT